MRRFVLPLFVLIASGLMVLGGGCSPREPTGGQAGPASGGTAAGTKRSASGLADHDGQRAMAYLKALSDSIGPRVAGSSAEQKAADYIAGRLRDDGYAVELMPFDFAGNRFRPGTVTVGATAYAAIALDGSSGGTVTGPALFVGIGDAAGIGGRSLDGKIAVADRGTLTFAEKYDRVKAFGAAGLVILNTSAGQVNGTARKGGSIPVVSIAGEDANAVRAAAQQGEQLTIQAPSSETSTGIDVIARPTVSDSCQVLVGAHFDTVAAAPGANDNASGVANLLEVARAAGVGGAKRGLCFAAWSAEESGLFGSQAYVERATAVHTLPNLYLNLDVTGIGRRVEIIGEGPEAGRALALADDNGIAAERTTLPPNTGSDHASFAQVEVETVFLTSGEFRTIHSPADVAADIDVDELDRVGDLALLLVQAVLPQVAAGGGHP